MNTHINHGDRARKLGTISQNDLPAGRKGKHHPMLLDVLDALEDLEEGRAIKVPLTDYSGTLADMRSAIHRATRKRDMEVLTSSDDEYLYVWKPERKTGTE